MTAANGSVTSNKSPVVSLSVVLPGMQISRTRGAAASPSPTRLLRLTTESLEVWSLQVAAGGPEAGAGKVSGGAGNGTQSLEVRHPLLRNVQAALGGGRKVCLLDLVVAGDVRTVSVAGGDAMATLSGFEMEVLVLAAAVAVDGGGLGEQMGDFSLHLVRISSAEASWVGSSGSVKVGVFKFHVLSLIDATLDSSRFKLCLWLKSRGFFVVGYEVRLPQLHAPISVS